MAQLRRRRQKAEAISSTMPISTSSRGAEAWGSAPPISGGGYLARFLDLVCNRIGVPMKPNFLRIWLTRYRSCEKCSEIGRAHV